MTAVHPAGAERPGVRRLRTIALLRLATHPELPPAALAQLRATQVRQSGDQGALYLRVPRGPGALLIVRLTDPQQEALLAYLEAARLWGEPTRLFPKPAAIRKALYRRRKALIAARSPR